MLPSGIFENPPAAVTLIAAGAMILSAKSEAQTSAPPNPISRIARIFTPQLVHVEDRVNWLDKQISSFVVKRELPLKYEIGYRGGRLSRNDPFPSVTVDLGSPKEVDQIFLVPSQKEFSGDQGIFPKRFVIEMADTADFAGTTIIFQTGSAPFIHSSSGPVQFNCQKKARYIRLTVQEGHNKGTLDMFGLSELVAVSKGEPLTFGCNVSVVGNISVPGMWTPQALTDSRTPLGTWQHGGRINPAPGDVVFPEQPETLVSWSASLPTTAAVDRIILHPYQLDRSFESLILPEEITLNLEGPDGNEVLRWENPVPGGAATTPLVFPIKGKNLSSLTITASRPLQVGERFVSAISEIAVWSEGRNILRERPVTRNYAGKETIVPALTNGYTSDHYIIPVGSWLSQLSQREKIEKELASLRPIQKQISSRSELNATWGSAVVLGLTFLIPVFVVERRRLMSRRQLDMLRKRIASDLHDDIGSNLGSISLIARTARKDLVRLHGPENVAEDLGEMESIARESSLAMRDIVWLLERKQDSIGDLVQRMRETAVRLLREMQCELDCKSTRTAARLSLDAKRHLFLFYKEGIHNVLKHSQAKHVSIRLWDHEDKLAMEIIDDGIGIPLDDNNQPVGMSKLKDRARVLDGQLTIHTASEKGTRILLMVKRSLLTATPANP